MANQQSEDLTAPRNNSGRPRDIRLDERVLAATRESVAELGWERTSIRGVAERSGVSRPAIARRWPSKAHLVLESILGAAPDLEAFDGVDLAGWISAVIDGSFELFDRTDVHAAAPGLLATLRDHEDIRRALWDGFSGPASALALHFQPNEQVDGNDVGTRGRPAPERIVDAQAAIVLAAGAALFLSLVVGGDEQIRTRVTTALAASMAGMLDHSGEPFLSGSSPGATVSGLPTDAPGRLEG